MSMSMLRARRTGLSKTSKLVIAAVGMVVFMLGTTWAIFGIANATTFSRITRAAKAVSLASTGAEDITPLPPKVVPSQLSCAPFIAEHPDVFSSTSPEHVDASVRVRSEQIGRTGAASGAAVEYLLATHRSGDIVSDHVRSTGIWEPWTLAVLSAALADISTHSAASPRIDFIDVGANLGFFTSFVAAFAPRARVLAFEPFEMNTHALMRTVCKLNPHWASDAAQTTVGGSIAAVPAGAGAGPRVHVYRGALSEAAGVDMCMWSTHDLINRGNARLTRTFTGVRTFDADRNKRCKERFETSTLDHVLFSAVDGPRLVDSTTAASAAGGRNASLATAPRTVPLAAAVKSASTAMGASLASFSNSNTVLSPRVRAMKIDVEGFETMVLRGAGRLLSGPLAPCYIVFEYQVRELHCCLRFTFFEC